MWAHFRPAKSDSVFTNQISIIHFLTNKEALFRQLLLLEHLEHSIRTRNSSEIIRLPMITTEYARKSFSFTGAKEYNMLPLEAREMPTTDFLTFLKKHSS